jgi:hypothetical protein
MFTAIRAWYYRFVLGLIEHDIEATLDEIHEFESKGDLIATSEMRRYLNKLQVERSMLLSRLAAIAKART